MTQTQRPEDAIPWCSTGDEFDDIWDQSPWSKEQPDSVPDILCTMFAQQRQHMQAYSELGHEPVEPYLHGDLSNRQVQAALREFAGYMTEELYEAVNLLKAKPWKKNPQPTDEQEFREELADYFHFVIEFFIIAGIDPEELFRQYFRKTFINVHRQHNGY